MRICSGTPAAISSVAVVLRADVQRSLRQFGGREGVLPVAVVVARADPSAVVVVPDEVVLIALATGVALKQRP